VRTAAGIAFVAVLLLAAGHGVLLGIGLVQVRTRALVAASGLAYLAGLAATMLVGIVVLVIGGSFDLPLFAVTALAISGAGVGLALRRGRREAEPGAPVPAPAPTRAQRLLVAAGLAALAAFLFIGLLDAAVYPLGEWDGWSIWTRKAIVLTSSGLDPHFFASNAYQFAHLDYPILQPLFESVYFRAMGGVDGQAVHVTLWLLLVASLGALAYLGSRFARVWVWLPVVLAVGFGAAVYGQLLTAYADVPMGLMAAPGVLCLGLWLRNLDRRHLVLAALLLAAAASIKNEGLLVMVSAFFAAAIVLAAARLWRPLLLLAGAGLGAGIAVAPWRLWTHFNDVTSDLPIGSGLDPSYVLDRSDRFTPSLKALLPQLESGALGYVVPAALALILAALVTRGLRRIAAFYMLAGLGTFASVIWAFMITPSPLDYQIATSVTRVVMGVAFVSVAALVQLGGMLDSHREAPAAPGPAAAIEPELEAREPARA
jgi:hypothetical protein